MRRFNERRSNIRTIFVVRNFLEVEACYRTQRKTCRGGGGKLLICQLSRTCLPSWQGGPLLSLSQRAYSRVSRPRDSCVCSPTQLGEAQILLEEASGTDTTTGKASFHLPRADLLTRALLPQYLLTEDERLYFFHVSHYG